MALPKYDANRVPDREIKAAPGEEVCDFCSSPHPKWGFPCRPHVSGVIPVHMDGGPGQTVAQSPDDWAACEECATLILKADREGVTQRSILKMPREYRRIASPRVVHNAVR